MSDYAAARYFMVEGQIRPNKVTDLRLVEALHELPREVFVPMASRGIAYVDDDLAVGNGRYLLEPMVFARMVQEAGVQASDVVLDVGCATGYSTALLSRLAATVVGVEADAELAGQASAALIEVGCDNAIIVNGAHVAGYASQAPYDLIVLAGKVAIVPETLTGQLADGGRLIAIVENASGVGEVRLYQRFGAAVSSRALFEANPHSIPGFEIASKFVF